MKEGFPIFSETLSFTYVSAGTRTQDLRIKSPLLYQLSYALFSDAESGGIPKINLLVNRQSPDQT